MRMLTISLLLALVVMTTAQIALGQCEICGTFEDSGNDGLPDLNQAYAMNLTGEVDTVDNAGFLVLSGDPSISGYDGILLKIAPLETEPRVCVSEPSCGTFRLVTFAF